MVKKNIDSNLEKARQARARKAELQAELQEQKNKFYAEQWAKKAYEQQEKKAAEEKARKKKQETIELLTIAAEQHPPDSEERLKEKVAICYLDDKRGIEVAVEETVKFFLQNKKINTIRHDVIAPIYIYNPANGEHEEHGGTKIKEVLERVYGEKFTIKLSNLILERIRNNTYITSEDFYEVRDPWKINCANGEIDLKQKKLLPFNPDSYHITSIPIKFDPEAKCPEIDEFIKTVLPNEKDQLGFFELAGYLLFRGMPLQHIFFFVNAGGGGKGQTIILLIALVGKRNTCAVSLKRQASSPFAGAAKKGKLLNSPGEIGSAKISDSTEVKGQSGDDFIEIEQKFKPSETVKLYAKDVHAANDLPFFEDQSIGMFRRPILFNFTQRFVTQEEYEILVKKNQAFNVHPKILHYGETLAKKEQEMSGFLNKAIDGLNRLMTKGEFSNALTPDEMRVEYLRRSNTIASFFTEIVDASYAETGENIPKNDLYSYYETYCAELSSAPKTQDAFFKFAIKEGGFEEVKKTINGIRKRCFSGIFVEPIAKRMAAFIKKPENVRPVRAFSTLYGEPPEKKLQKSLFNTEENTFLKKENESIPQQEREKVGQVGQEPPTDREEERPVLLPSGRPSNHDVWARVSPLFDMPGVHYGRLPVDRIQHAVPDAKDDWFEWAFKNDKVSDPRSGWVWRIS